MSVKEKVPVIFRKHLFMGEWEVMAYFYDAPALPGNIMSYEHIGQHGEASLEYYHSGKPATPEEYAELLKELQCVYNDCELIVKKRINRDILASNWR